MEQEFRSQLESRLLSYFEMEEQIETRITDLTEQLAAVRRRAQAARDLYKAEYGQEFDRARAKRRPAEARPPEGPLTGMTWGEAIARVISDAGRPLHVKEIWQALQAGGFGTDSSDPQRSIVSICVRNPHLTKTAPATYAVDGYDDGRRSLRPAPPTSTKEK
jgi:hypothetical protein